MRMKKFDKRAAVYLRAPNSDLRLYSLASGIGCHAPQSAGGAFFPQENAKSLIIRSNYPSLYILERRSKPSCLFRNSLL